jgi:cell pole-organizing protein PopZ
MIASKGRCDVESAMTQPAKAQEPSMEEILASIRRIIADDESKPAVTQATPEPARAAAAKVPPRVAPVQTVEAAPKPIAPKPAAPPPPPAPAAKNSQEDIDAMLAGLDAETSEAEIRVPEPQNDVFELTEQMAIPEAPPAPVHQAAAFQQLHPQDDLEFSEPPPSPKNYQAAAPDPASFAEAEVPPARALMSASTMASVESAFNSLANTVLSNNARTLEDLVKEMLRPMLKSWIDDNLPKMVERIVRAEIERVSRGR